MEKIYLAAGVLFAVSATFSFSSLVLPDWIITEIRGSRSGPSRFGLSVTCAELAGGRRDCGGQVKDGVWSATFACVLLQTIFAGIAAAYCFSQHRVATRGPMAKVYGLVAIVFSCLAAIIFPMGFGALEIGGSAYQLPHNSHVGQSYILFVLSLWTLIVSLLCAGKFCIPRL